MYSSRLLTPVVLLLLLISCAAWSTPEEEAAQLDEELLVLDIMHTLDLTTAQCQALLPIVEEAQLALKARDAGIEDIWKQAKEAVLAVNQAWETRTAPEPEAKTTADEATRAHHAIIEATRNKMDEVAAKARELLTREQLALLEAPAPAPMEDPAASGPDPRAIITELARDIAVLRQARPDEYEMSRIIVAARLAVRVSAPDANDFGLALAQGVQFVDNWRWMTDADFSEHEPELAGEVARFLGLPEQPNQLAAAVSLTDFMRLLASPYTADLLKAYQPPATIAPDGGGGQ